MLAALRQNSDGVDLRSLGHTLRTEFSDDDVPWIAGVVDSLRKDGLAMIAEDRPTYSIESVDESSIADNPWIRLPE